MQILVMEGTTFMLNIFVSSVVYHHKDWYFMENQSQFISECIEIKLSVHNKSLKEFEIFELFQMVISNTKQTWS